MARPTSRTRQATAEAPRKKRRGARGLIGPGILVLLVAAIVLVVLLDEPAPGIEFQSQGNFHLDTIDQDHGPYNSAPPSSGPHFGGIAPWGAHDDPVPPELFVHNLEDGGVVLAYDCPEGCPDVVDALTDRLDEGRVLVTPYEGIVDTTGANRRIAAVAWTRVLYLDDVDGESADELDVFISLFEGVDHHVGG
jgi:hypothetical protein